MSQLLAALTGPAFYPLPGIGRMETLEKKTAAQAYARSEMHIKEQQVKANETTVKILSLIKKRKRTYEDLSEELGVSESTVKRHTKLLMAENQVEWVREANTVYWRVPCAA